MGHGQLLLRDWIGRAGLSLTTLRAFGRGSLVVLAQHGVWRSLETGDMTVERELASRFVVDRAQVALFARYDALADALAAAGLTVADELA